MLKNGDNKYNMTSKSKFICKYEYNTVHKTSETPIFNTDYIHSSKNRDVKKTKKVKKSKKKTKKDKMLKKAIKDKKAKKTKKIKSKKKLKRIKYQKKLKNKKTKKKLTKVKNKKKLKNLNPNNTTQLVLSYLPWVKNLQRFFNNPISPYKKILEPNDAC